MCSKSVLFFPVIGKMRSGVNLIPFGIFAIKSTSLIFIQPLNDIGDVCKLFPNDIIVFSHSALNPTNFINLVFQIIF